MCRICVISQIHQIIVLKASFIALQSWMLCTDWNHCFHFHSPLLFLAMSESVTPPFFLNTIMVICIKECCIGYCAAAWIVSRKMWEKVGCASDQKHFLLECGYSRDLIPGSARNVLMYIVPQIFGPVRGGKYGWKIFLLQKPW